MQLPFLIAHNSILCEVSPKTLIFLEIVVDLNVSGVREYLQMEASQMSLEGYEQLKLENQLCFPLYVTAKEVVRKYKPYLDKLDLTYTQYIAMMVLWEKESLNVKELGSQLYLDSGTLTPLLKKLENKGYITRCRCKEDERNLIISITEKGEALKEEAAHIPAEMTEKWVNLSKDEIKSMYHSLYKLLAQIQ